MDIWFNSVANEFGWMGNMAPYPIQYQGKTWRTSEALFQSMRFACPIIQESIRVEKSPMGAKMRAPAQKLHMSIIPASDQDLNNLRFCVSLKFEQHETLRTWLLATGTRTIYEDVSNRRGGRHLFWGARIEQGQIIGENNMGKILMDLRQNLLLES